MIKEYPYKEVFKAVNNWATNELERKKLKYAADLPSFMQLQNHLGKSIITKPRTVSYSKIFKVPPAHSAGFDKLVEKISNGHNINPYLSRKLYDADFVDGLLDFYGCYHFHLGDKRKGKFIKGTKLLALAMVTPNEVFFIDIQPHGDSTWNSTSTLEIVHNERPELIEKSKVTQFKNISPIITDTNQIKDLRQGDISYAVTLKDGTSYMHAKLGQILMKDERKTPNLAVEHSLKMQYLINNIYRKINQFIRNFKIKNNCTITNVNIHGFKSNNNSELSEFRITIDYLKEFQLETFETYFHNTEL